MKLDNVLLPLFTSFPEVKILLSKKVDGSMKIQSAIENNEHIVRNRKAFFTKHRVTDQNIVSTQIAHGNQVTVVSHKDVGTIVSKTDGLVTDEKNLFLSVTVADCLPIFLYEPEKKIIGILHAGWKGLDKHIIDGSLNVLYQTFGVTPEKVYVGIGPGIGLCHFKVQDDVLQKFAGYPDASQKRNDQYFLDIKQIAKQQLIQKNVQVQNVYVSPLCTYCESEKYFSYRRDKQDPLQAMVASIGCVIKE